MSNSNFSEWIKLGGPSLNPTYLSNKDAGINSSFFVPALIRSFISLIAILLNLSVCYITIKYGKKYLSIKSNTSILLAINSFFEILTQSGQFIILAITVCGKNLIPFGKIVFYQIYSMLGFYSTIFMFTTLSFDRLLAVAFPIFYKTINRRRHICVHFIAIILLNCYLIFISIKAFNDFFDWPVNGTIRDFVSIISLENNLLNSIPLKFLPPIILYSLIGLILYIKQVAKDEMMKKIYRSLFLIISINIGGYFLTLLIVNYILKPLIGSENPFSSIIIYNLPVITFAIGSASNAPILFINSNDYNNAYKKEFKLIKLKIFKFFGIKQQTLFIKTIVVLPRNNTT